MMIHKKTRKKQPDYSKICQTCLENCTQKSLLHFSKLVSSLKISRFSILQSLEVEQRMGVASSDVELELELLTLSDDGLVASHGDGL